MCGMSWNWLGERSAGHAGLWACTCICAHVDICMKGASVCVQSVHTWSSVHIHILMFLCTLRIHMHVFTCLHVHASAGMCYAQETVCWGGASWGGKGSHWCLWELKSRTWAWLKMYLRMSLETGWARSQCLASHAKVAGLFSKSSTWLLKPLRQWSDRKEIYISRKVTLAQPPCWRITSGSLALTSHPNFRPKFIIGCWASSTRHLKFKAAKNKISISLKNILSLSLICLEEWHHPQTMIQSKNIRVNILLFHSFQPSIDKLIIEQISPPFSSFQSHIIPFLDCHSRTASSL